MSRRFSPKIGPRVPRAFGALPTLDGGETALRRCRFCGKRMLATERNKSHRSCLNTARKMWRKRKS